MDKSVRVKSVVGNGGTDRVQEAANHMNTLRGEFINLHVTPPPPKKIKHLLQTYIDYRIKICGVEFLVNNNHRMEFVWYKIKVYSPHKKIEILGYLFFRFLDPVISITF